MSFFCQPQSSIAQEQEMDLFQLLSLLDSSSPHPCAPRRHQRQAPPAPTFIPAFDILETASSYELFGEVPGLDVKTLDIQFSDAQTLVLKGVSGRSAPSVEKAVETEKVVEKAKAKQASVEDGEEEYDAVDTPLSASSTVENKEEKKEAVKEEKKVQARYWLKERKVGGFARSFSFAQRIEIDDVKAELKEGVLHVVVPKSVKSKKVVVSVV